MEREKICRNKFICVLLILLLIALTTVFSKFPLINSVKEYSLDKYLKVNNFDDVLGSKKIIKENIEINKYREDTDKNLINEILAYFNSFEYIKGKNVINEYSGPFYEFKFKNNSSYERIIIDVRNNREIVFIKYRGLATQDKERILLRLVTKRKEIDMDYIDKLFNSLSKEV